MFPVTGVSELNGSSKYTPEDCCGNGWELFSELTCGFSFVSLIRRKKKKMRRAAGWHMRSIFLLLCSGRVSKLSTQGCSFFFFFCHTSLRCSEMNTDGYNRALGSVCDWCLIPEVGQNHSRPNHSFLSALVKHEVSEESGVFFCCSSSSLLYFWIIFVLKCATGRPLSQNVWQLRLWIFGVNGAGWDDEVS